MQSTTSQKLIEGEFWWPSPDAFHDLTVTDIEDGWELSAPDNAELAVWLAYWNQDEERHALFQTVFVKALTEHANLVLNTDEQHGEAEVTNGNTSNSEQTENECPGPLT